MTNIKFQLVPVCASGLTRLFAMILTAGLTASVFLGATVSYAEIALQSSSVPTAEYRFNATVDDKILPDVATEVWARTYWPKDLSGPEKLPVVFFLHGNHSTCGVTTGRFPRVDDSCEYTFEGTCPAGKEVVRNHEGYTYLAEALVKKGFIVVSVNANRGITCNSGSEDDRGLNLSRGRLLLKHISLWQQWSQVGMPQEVADKMQVAKDAFVGKVNLQRVGLLGHSRGGEGARAAYNLLEDAGSAWRKEMPDVQFRGIFEIGAVDGQTSRKLDADKVAWNQLIPMCDGDVSDFQGRNPFDRMLAKSQVSDPTSTRVLQFPKSITGVFGANHNFFNSQWQESDADFCYAHDTLFEKVTEAQLLSGTAPQQKVAVKLVEDFFAGYVKAESELPEAAAARSFNPLSAVPAEIASITKLQREFLMVPRSADLQVNTAEPRAITDFSKTVLDPLTGHTNFQGISYVSEFAKQNLQISAGYPGIWVSWKKAAPLASAKPPGDVTNQLGFEIALGNLNLTSAASLDLRISPSLEGNDQDDRKRRSPDFTFYLVDQAGRTSSPLALADVADVFVPGSMSNTTYHTVRLPLTKLTGVDLSAGDKFLKVVFDRQLNEPNAAVYPRDVLFKDLIVSYQVAWDHGLLPLVGTGSSSTMGADISDRISGAMKNWLFSNSSNRVLLPVEFKVSQKPMSQLESVSGDRFSLSSQKSIRSAQLLKITEVGDWLEIYVRSLKGHFPVSEDLPRLILGEQSFTSGRFSSTGKLDVMIFKVNRKYQSPASVMALGDGSIKILIGRGSGKKVWQVRH